MAKLTMKDYENFLEEEARQDRLQEDLEYKRYEESYESEENWRDYQRKQEEERRWEAFNRHPEYDGYFDERDFFDDWEPEGEYDPDCYSNPYPDDDDPYDDGRRYDDYWGDDDLDDDDLDDDLYNCYSEFDTEDIVMECHIAKKSDERNQQEDRICRKAVARNRHHAAEKAKRRAQQSATILASRYRNANLKTDYEEFRLYSRSIAAEKKAARIKTA